MGGPHVRRHLAAGKSLLLVVRLGGLEGARMRVYKAYLGKLARHCYAEATGVRVAPVRGIAAGNFGAVVCGGHSPDFRRPHQHYNRALFGVCGCEKSVHAVAHTFRSTRAAP